MNHKRKIAIYTGNRAEYGLQNPIIKAVSEHSGLDYYLLVSGAHLQEDFGSTKKEIESDGFNIYQEIKIESIDDTLFSTANAIGTGIISLSRVLSELSPDILVVYADRFEGLSAVITGSQMNIATAHIEGGDLTEGGALDDSVRHSMTKLSHLHFCTNSEAKDRILRLGEEPWRVHNVGFPAIDLLANGNFASSSEVEKKYNLDINLPIILFTQHSVTTEYENASNQIIPSIEALCELSMTGIQVIITYPNNDAGGKKIIEEINKIDLNDYPNIQIHNSLGRYYYHGVLNLCSENEKGICAGNSSSGIKETPFFGVPTVNIGSRQNGRLRSSNVIDTNYDKTEIIETMNKALFDRKFRDICNKCDNPYGVGDAGKKIANALFEIELNQNLYIKKMTY